ncbi:hypothetical protein ACJIZ3_018398 [Penstemon smallii]|uniref:Cytochrome P450 n=1 Tax=Penstemon smallii TaxID=265156 RepID=A0ABD3SY81_9LAMI
MDSIQTLLLLLLLILCFAIWVYAVQIRHRNSYKLPPGPKPFPIIGNIFELGQNPHKSLAKLSKIYGPLMSLKLGSMTTIVVSSPETAKLVLLKYDQNFSDRPTLNAMRPFDHHKLSVAWVPVGNKWRKLRKICKEQMFSVLRLDASQSLRKEKLQQLWDYVNDCCTSGEVVDIGRAAFTTSMNLMSATLFSVDFAAFGSDSSREFREIIQGIMALAGKPNVTDYFPILQTADPQGIFREIKHYFEKCFEIFDEIINQRMQERGLPSDFPSKNDMLEALIDLKLKKETELNFDDIKHLLLNLFVAGTDTSSVTVEWALTELMLNPGKMLKAQNELRNVIGQIEQVQESDISKLPYLRAVIKETFRLHPAAPLSVPHKAKEDIEIQGYIVPKDTQTIVNIWAIGRDSSVWSEPDLFMPERFLEQETDFHGQHFELIPFGGGRRICLGLPLANRTVHLMVATFIHNFDWKLEGGLKPGEIDMTENFGLTLQKATPLKAVPFKVM